MFKKIKKAIHYASIVAALLLLTAVKAAGYDAAYTIPDISNLSPADAVIAVAESQLGYTEDENECTIYSEWANQSGRAWCSEFVSWCAYKAGIPQTIVPLGTSSHKFRSFFSNQQRYYWMEGGCCFETDCECSKLYTATISVDELKPGDIVLTETNNNIYDGTDHSCIFLYADDKYIYTIDGNYNSQVTYSKKVLSKIHGICRPDYFSCARPKITKSQFINGGVTLAWNVVEDATSYRVYRSNSRTNTKTLLKTVGTTSCVDTTVKADNTYNYYIVACNSKTGATSNYSDPVSVTYPTLATPKIPSLTQSKGIIKISWVSVSGATSYKIYRATSATGAKTLLKSVSTTSCEDTTAVLGNTYYYFIQAYNSKTGVTSAYSGYKSLKFTSLAPPNLNKVTVSGNTVNLKWSAVPNATSYRVYRGTSATGAKSLLKTVSTTSCNNTSVTAGTTYYYYIVAYSSKTGTMSEASNSKSVKVSGATISSVTQSKGKVKISWNSVSGATSYRVYRATSATGTKTLLKTVSTTSCTDTTAAFGTTYYYFVQAYNSKTGTAYAYSNCRSIRFTSLAPPTLSSVTISGNTINIRWSAVSGATSYKVYRGTSATGTKTLLKTVSTTSCNNTSFTPKTTYYYYVVAYNSKTNTYSAASNAKSITINSALATPKLNSLLAEGSSVTLKWSAVSGATSYRVYRATSATGTKSLLKTVGITSCKDTTAIAGGTYYYFVAAYNSKNGDLSNYSNYKAIIV